MELERERERERLQELQELKEEYKRSILALHRKKFDWNQIQIISFILDQAETESQIRDLFNIFLERIKFGLTFDWSQESSLEDKKMIALLKKDDQLSFQTRNHVRMDNTLILGNNFDVLSNLLITHREKVNVIYIDPPYNTGGDSLGYEDKRPKDIWLSNIKERLQMAKQLLSRDGIIFVSIDDNMQAYLKVLMDEIFGEENFICNFIWEKTYSPKNNAKLVSANHDYILCYRKSSELDYLNKLNRNIENNKQYKYDDYDGNGPYRLSDLTIKGSKGYSIFHNGIEYKEPTPNGWRYSKEKMDQLIAENKIWFPSNPDGRPAFKRYLNEVEGIISKTILPHSLVGHTDENQKLFNQIMGLNSDGTQKFNYPKGAKLIKYLINLHPNKKALVLDFYAGSGTTGEAVLELNCEDHGNRKFILCTLDEDQNNNIGTKVCYERLYRINHGYGTQNEEIPEWLKSHEPYHENLNVYRITYKDISLKNASPFLNFDFTPYTELNDHLNFESTDDLFENLYYLTIRNWWK